MPWFGMRRGRSVQSLRPDPRCNDGYAVLGNFLVLRKSMLRQGHLPNELEKPHTHIIGALCEFRNFAPVYCRANQTPTDGISHDRLKPALSWELDKLLILKDSFCQACGCTVVPRDGGAVMILGISIFVYSVQLNDGMWCSITEFRVCRNVHGDARNGSQLSTPCNCFDSGTWP
jgi:hypothetical protein